jgi:maltodextrin utilization protein YvdJ
MNIITFVYVNFIVKYTNNNYSNEYKILTFSQIMSYMRKPILKIFCACLLLLKVNTNNQKRTRYDSCYLNVIQTSHKERLLQPVLNTKTANRTHSTGKSNKKMNHTDTLKDREWGPRGRGRG